MAVTRCAVLAWFNDTYYLATPEGRALGRRWGEQWEGDSVGILGADREGQPRHFLAIADLAEIDSQGKLRLRFAQGVAPEVSTYMHVLLKQRLSELDVELLLNQPGLPKEEIVPPDISDRDRLQELVTQSLEEKGFVWGTSDGRQASDRGKIEPKAVQGQNGGIALGIFDPKRIEPEDWLTRNIRGLVRAFNLPFRPPRRRFVGTLQCHPTAGWEIGYLSLDRHPVVDLARVLSIEFGRDIEIRLAHDLPEWA